MLPFPTKKKGQRPIGRTLEKSPKPIAVLDKLTGEVVEALAVDPRNVSDAPYGTEVAIHGDPVRQKKFAVGKRFAVLCGKYDGDLPPEPRKACGLIGWGTAIAYRADYNDPTQPRDSRMLALDVETTGVEAYNHKIVSEDPVGWAGRKPIGPDGVFWLSAVLLDSPARWGQQSWSKTTFTEPQFDGLSLEDIEHIRSTPLAALAESGRNAILVAEEDWEEYTKDRLVLVGNEAYSEFIAPVVVAHHAEREAMEKKFAGLLGAEDGDEAEADKDG